MSVLEMEPGLATIVSGGPMEGPDAECGMEPAMVIDLMGQGSVIEKNPTPVASIIANQPAAEAILQRMFGPSPEEGDEHVRPGERFTPYQLTGDPAEIFGGIRVVGEDVEGATAFIRKLLGSIGRPSDEEKAVADMQGSVTIEGSQSEVQEPSRGKNLMLALRRSKLGKAVSASAIVAAGALSWVSSASAGGLKDTCAPTIFNKGKILESEMHNPGKNNQDIIINIHVGEVDPQCDGAFKRVVYVRPQIKHKGQSKWINEDIYTSIYNGDTSAANDIGGVFFSNPGNQPERLWHPGSRVRFQEKIQEKNEVTGKIVRTKIYPRRVQVISG